jgi:hypothetical protein
VSEMFRSLTTRTTPRRSANGATPLPLRDTPAHPPAAELDVVTRVARPSARRRAAPRRPPLQAGLADHRRQELRY